MIQKNIFFVLITMILVSCKEYHNKGNINRISNNKEIKAGAILFQSTCVKCHNTDGSGGEGPNLTDSYWMNGNSVDDVIKVIRLGMSNGMPAYKLKFNSEEIRNVALYILTLPYNVGKRPQGVELK